MVSNRWVNHLFPFLSWLTSLDRDTVRSDVVAGITAGILILPQAIALATLAGMPPEYGLYTSIFPVIVAALYGSSWHAMSGPNTALCLLMGFSIAPYAAVATPDWIQYAITLTFMAAVIQLAIGVLRLGTMFNYFSQTVMVALVTGVGITIIVQQLGNFMGVLMNTAEPIEDAMLQVFYNAPRANGFALLVGVVTLVSGLVVKSRFPKWPHLIVAVVAGMVCAQLVEWIVGPAIADIDKLGTMTLSALPLSAPDFRPEVFAEAQEGLIPAAFLVAFLGLMQSAVISRSMAAQSGQHVDINQEVIGQGLSNLVGSFLSCFASCSSFNRSASNIETGARTPLAAIVSVFALAALVLLASPVIAQLPIAVMAGVLVLVGAGLIKVKDIRQMLRMRGEARLVFLVTVATTVYGGLDMAVFLGIALSVGVYLMGASKPEFELLFSDEARRYRPEHVKNAIALRISGSLFFGAVDKVEQAFTDIAALDGRKGSLILAAEQLHSIDSTGAELIAREAKRRRANGGQLCIWLRNRKLEEIFRDSGLTEAIGENNIFYVNSR